VETLISGHRVDRLHDLLSNNPGRPDILWRWVTKIIPDPDTPLLSLLEGMLHKNPKQRPSISVVVSELHRLGGAQQSYHGNCCKDPSQAPIYTYSLGIDFRDLSAYSVSDYTSQDQHSIEVDISDPVPNLYYS
jgi:hypothetical protein